MPVISARRRSVTRRSVCAASPSAVRWRWCRTLDSAPMSASTIPLAVPVPPSADVLGTRVALVDYATTMDWMDAMVAAGQRGYVCVAAVHIVMAAREDAGLRAAVDASSLTVPDGQPVVWALNA